MQCHAVPCMQCHATNVHKVSVYAAGLVGMSMYASPRKFISCVVCPLVTPLPCPECCAQGIPLRCVPCKSLLLSRSTYLQHVASKVSVARVAE